MEIKYLGYASFKLKNKAGMVVVIDPFKSDFVGLKMPKEKADIVVVSRNSKGHGATDEINGAVKREEVFVVDGPGEYEVGGVEVSAIQLNGSDKRVTVVRMDDLSVCHLSSLDKELPASVKKEVGAADVLLVGVGRKDGLGVGEMGKLVKEMSPSLVIPMEYKVAGLKEGVGEVAELEEFLEKNNMKVGENGSDKIRVTTSSLPEDMQVVVLNAGN